MKKNPMGLISMICGIIGILSSCILIGIIPCTAALILSIICLKGKKSNLNMAIAGLITSVIGIVIFCFMMVVVIKGIKFSESETQIKEEIITETETIEESSIVESTKETINTSAVETEEIVSQTIDEKSSEESTEIIETTEDFTEDKLLTDLKGILSEEVANKTYDILVNQIGFQNVEYIGKNSVGTTNYDFTSEKYNFTVTASDDVYRIFQPSSGFVFYEDGQIKNTVSSVESKKIDNNDKAAYYYIAQMIVESGLKNPGSSDFPSIVTRPEEIAMSKKDNIVAVQSWVEAKNSFNAKIRSQWIAEFSIIDLETYSYEPIYLNIDGEVLFGEFVDVN